MCAFFAICISQNRCCHWFLHFLTHIFVTLLALPVYIDVAIQFFFSLEIPRQIFMEDIISILFIFSIHTHTHIVYMAYTHKYYLLMWFTATVRCYKSFWIVTEMLRQMRFAQYGPRCMQMLAIMTYTYTNTQIVKN